MVSPLHYRDLCEYYEALKQEKAVDDPHIRRKDPGCWECLSDEQRDTINEWYMDILIDNERNREAAEEAAQSPWPAIIGLIPLAFFYTAAGYVSRPIPKFLFAFITKLAVFYVVFLLFSSAYSFAKKRKPLDMDRFESFWFHLLAVVSALAVTGTVVYYVLL